MAIEFTQEEAKVLSQFAYMNLEKKDYEKKTLQQMAAELLENRVTDGSRDFGRWGGFTNEEQYNMLQKIVDGKYENLSNLRVIDCLNNEGGKDKFVAYAFEDANNPQDVFYAFRGSMGSRVGEESLREEINGKLGYSWWNNYNQILNDANPQYPMAVDFVKAHMVPGGKTLSVGHSQGGGVALYTSAVIPGVRSIVFDAPGISNSLTAEQAATLKLQSVNIASQVDFCSSSGRHPELRNWVQYFPYPKLDKDSEPVRDENGQIKMLEGVGAGHYLQTQRFDAAGTPIPGARSEFSIAVEELSQKLYVENKAEGNRLGDDVLMRQIVVLNDPEGVKKIIECEKQLHPEAAQEFDDRLVRIQAEAEKIQAAGQKIDEALNLQPGTSAAAFINTKMGYDGYVLFQNTIEKYPEASMAYEKIIELEAKDRPGMMAGIHLLGGFGNLARGVDYYHEGFVALDQGITNFEEGVGTVINENMQSMSKSINAIVDNGIDKMKEQVSNCDGDMENIRNAVQAGVADIGINIAGAMGSANKHIAEGIGTAATGLNDLYDGLSGYGAFAAVAGEVKDGENILQAIYDGQQERLQHIEQGMAKIGTGLDEVKNGVLAGYAGIKDSIYEGICTSIDRIEPEVIQLSGDMWDIGDTLHHNVDGIKSQVADGLNNIGAGINEQMSDSIGLIKEGLQDYAKGVYRIGQSHVDFASALGYGAVAAGDWADDNIIQPGINVAEQFTHSINEGLEAADGWVERNIAQPAMNTVQSEPGFDNHEYWMPRALEQMKSIFKDVENFNPYEAVRSHVAEWPRDGQDALEVIRKLEDQSRIESLDHQLSGDASEINTNESMEQTVSNIIRGVGQTMSDAAESAEQTVSNIDVEQRVSEVVHNVEQTVSDVVQGVEQTASDVIEGVEQTVSNAVQGVQETISTAYQDSINCAKGWFQSWVNHPDPPVEDVAVSQSNAWVLGR